MKKKFDVKRIKEELREIIEQAGVFAKSGERELSRLASAGKAELDILGLNIKKKRLYYELGKKVYQLNVKGRLSTMELKKLCDKINELEKTLKSKKRSVAKSLKKGAILLIALSCFCLSLAGCGETVAGVGKDIRRVGKGVKTIFIKDGGSE